jgi:hypothetical protein
MLPERREQLVASVTSIVAIVPWGIFMGMMFVSNGRIMMSVSRRISWGLWFFAIITFWNPVFAALFSFIRPRISAYWIIGSVVISMTMGLLFQVQSALQPDSSHPSIKEWLENIPSLLLMGSGFWFFPS